MAATTETKMQVSQISIPIVDQERALKFYTETLGFTKVLDVDFGGPQRWIELSSPDGGAKIVLFTPEGHEDLVGRFSNIMFHTSDLQARYEELKAKGVEFTVPPTKEHWGTYCIYKDSEGNTFLISNS